MYWSENIMPGMFVSKLKKQKEKTVYVILIKDKNVRKLLNDFWKTSIKGIYKAKHTKHF